MESPSIEYSLDTTPTGPQRFDYILRLKNISRTKAFQDLSFFMEVYTGTLSDPKYLRVIAPARLLGGDNGDKARLEGKEMAVFPIAQLQPGWTIDLQVSQSGASTPQGINVSVYFLPHSSGNDSEATSEIQAVRLIPVSLETFVVNHEVNLLCILLTCWIVIIVLFFMGRWRKFSQIDEERARSATKR